MMRLASVALITALMAGSAPAGSPVTDSSVERIVARELATWPKEPGGAAVTVRIAGRTLFFNEGVADPATKRPITSDSLFNLASLGKVFDATLLALALRQGELSLDDPVDKYVTELQQSGDIRRVTLGQLATHTSGLLLPQDHPPWPTEGYTLPEFIRVLAAWKADKRHQPGKQHIYTHAGFILLHLALERRFQSPISDLIDARVLKPLGMANTILPLGNENGRAQLAPALLEQAVLGYSEEGEAIGAPGDVQGYYHWPGTAQMYSSARDMAAFSPPTSASCRLTRAASGYAGCAARHFSDGPARHPGARLGGGSWPAPAHREKRRSQQHDLLHRYDARREAWYPHSVQSRQ